MAASIKVSDLPPTKVELPVLSAGESLGMYGIDKNDVLVIDAAPSVFEMPSVEVIIAFNKHPMAWLKNPVNRTDLPEELRMSFPEVAIITNRNMLMKLLDIFLFASTKVFTIRVTRIKDQIFFLENPPFPDPPTGPAGKGVEKKYGIPFEEEITTNTNLDLEYLYVFQSYELMSSATLVVRCEVDCVNEKGELSEIKSRLLKPDMTEAEKLRYYQEVWRQMLFGRVQEAIIGTYITKKYKQPATFTTIKRATFEAIAARAGMDKGADEPHMTSLAALLQWIRGNIADGETKVFKFDTDTVSMSAP